MKIGFYAGCLSDIVDGRLLADFFFKKTFLVCFVVDGWCFRGLFQSLFGDSVTGVFLDVAAEDFPRLTLVCYLAQAMFLISL